MTWFITQPISAEDSDTPQKANRWIQAKDLTGNRGEVPDGSGPPDSPELLVALARDDRCQRRARRARGQNPGAPPDLLGPIRPEVASQR